MKVSLVSGTYNRIKSLQRMIGSVRKSVGTLEYEIVIVDVGSTDGSREWLREQPDVKLIEHPEPRGSATAFQDGFLHSTGEYVVTLNDDIKVNGNSVRVAAAFLDRFPDVGQVAFAHLYQNRPKTDPNRRVVQKAFGYVYGQCCMTRKWLGDLVGWCWSDEEHYVHYGWDNALSMKIWELGYRCVEHPDCSVTDWEIVDGIRKQFSDGMRDSRGVHPDTVRFMEVWKGRLPPPAQWIGNPYTQSKAARVVWLAKRGNLRTLRFKATMLRRQPMRHALIDVFARYGPARQVNRTDLVARLGQDGFQDAAMQIIADWKPDLVLAQVARDNSFTPQTFLRIRKRFPNVLLVNWEADPHVPLTPFHFEIARAADYHFTISPDLIPIYASKGVYNVGYWPIGVEDEYLADFPRGDFKWDVVFLGSRYPDDSYPLAKLRTEVVETFFHNPKISLGLWGFGWKDLGDIPYSGEAHAENADRYRRARLGLSISQVNTLEYYSSDRLYNIAATGCPPLVHRFKGMEEHGFVDGETCIVWNTIEEAVEKAQYYIEHEEERERIGAAARELMLRRHTWDRRVEEFFELIL